MKNGSLLLAFFVVPLLAACEYDPPPMIIESTPALGSVTTDTGTDIEIRFSEPIARESIQATLYRRKLDEEGRLLPRCEEGETAECITPVAGPCTVRNDCPNATMILVPDSNELRFDPDHELTPGEYVLRLGAGLEDHEGNATGVPLDLFFMVSPEGEGPTTFQPGVLITWLDLDQPFDFPIEVYWHIRVDPDTGEIYGGGCDGDPLDPDGERIFDHTLWKPVPYLDQAGFKIMFSGTVHDAQVEDAHGRLVDGYILETEPFYIYCAEPEVEVIDGSIAVTIAYDEELGRQVVEGTLTSGETYIFDTPEHAHPHQASGSLYGYRLLEDEIGSDQVWQDCAEPDTFTQP